MLRALNFADHKSILAKYNALMGCDLRVISNAEIANIKTPGDERMQNRNLAENAEPAISLATRIAQEKMSKR